MDKGLAVSTVLYLVIAVIILILFMPILIRSAGAVWNKILTSIGVIQPSLVDKAILCSYYRCKYGINDRRTVEACEQNFPNYNKPAAPCDQGGLACMADTFLPDGKVCDEVAAAYPIEVDLESDKEYEITKNYKFGEDGDADCMCTQYGGITMLSSCPAPFAWGSTVRPGDSLKNPNCLTEGICKLSIFYGGVDKVIFFSPDLGSTENVDTCGAGKNCTNSIKINKQYKKLYIVTSGWTTIFTDKDKIKYVVPTYVPLKVGEESNSFLFCKYVGGDTSGVYVTGNITIQDLRSDGSIEGIKGIRVAATRGGGLFATPWSEGPWTKVIINTTCGDNIESVIQGSWEGVHSKILCNGEYNLTVKYYRTDLENTIVAEVLSIKRMT